MKTALVTFNASYIHRNLALRWLYVCRPADETVRIMEFVTKDDVDKCAAAVAAYQPDAVGISVYIWNGTIVKDFIRRLKTRCPGLRIILGGPEVSFRWQDYLDDSVEAVIRGEGEATFWPYLVDRQPVAGLASHDYVDPDPYPKTDLAWLEEKENPYFLPFDLADMKSHYLYIETSRGCPYGCTYCLASTDHSNRQFSLPYLNKVLQQLHIYQPKQVKFLDRTFNADEKRAVQISHLLLALPKSISFQFEVVAENLPARVVDLWVDDKPAGRWRLEAGIQSFNDEALEAVGRYQNSRRLKSSITFLVSRGLTVHGDLIAGLPYQTRASFSQTYRQALQLNMAELQVGILKLLAGTILDRTKDDYGITAQTQPPYAIIANRWMSRHDIDDVYRTALATQRLYNNGWCRRFIGYLLTTGDDIFERMTAYGYQLEALGHPYQIHQVFQLIRQSTDDPAAIGMLAMDYFSLFTRRPVRYEPFDLDRTAKNQYFTQLVSQGAVSEDRRRFSMVAAGWYNNKKAIQILIYDSDQHKPQRFLVGLTGRLLMKENL